MQLKIGGFPGSSDSTESACNAGDPGLIPGSGRSPGEGNGLQSTGHKESDTTEWLKLYQNKKLSKNVGKNGRRQFSMGCPCFLFLSCEQGHWQLLSQPKFS